jgi:hypothetical protein
VIQSTSLAAVLAVALVVAPIQLLPVDEASTRPDFFSFRASLQRAIARHDTAALLAVIDPRIRNSFGDDGGIDEFRTKWKAGDPDSEIWEELGAVLALGGSFQDADTFAAPYVFSKWPEKFDSFEHVAVTGANVRVRAQPDVTASAIDTVSFAILPTSRQGSNKEGWTAIQIDKARVGYVSSAYVRSPIDYRAVFRFEDRRWRLVSFVAGD